MVKFVEVDPNDVPNFRESRRGRVSYPILKTFLETGMPIAMLDRTGVQQSMQSLTSSVGAYIRSHELPIKLFQRRGELYLMRTDVEADGTVPDRVISEFSRHVDNVGVAPAELLANQYIPPVNAAEVATRFQDEKGTGNK